MNIELYHTTEELKRMFRKEKDPRLSVRIRAIYLGLMDKTAVETAEILGYSRRVVQAWVNSYNRKGIEGLTDEKGRGCNGKLNIDQIQWLRQRIEQGPEPEDEVCVFTGKDIQRIIEKQFHVHYSLSGIYSLLHRLGYSHVSSRPEHPKGNPEARELFKKSL